jgi:hypothetical protein
VVVLVAELIVRVALVELMVVVVVEVECRASLVLAAQDPQA